jgi:hypothetical protein
MIPDPVDTTNAILLQLLASTGQNLTTLQNLRRQSVASPTSDLQLRLVNGLWFAALACSLSTALISMLAKQWLSAYPRSASGSPRDRARKRQHAYMALKAWHVPAIIDAKPLLLHVALLLFFAGLIVLLWSVDLGTTIATWAIVMVVYGFYFSSVLLPLLYPDCPYKHPLSEFFLKRSRNRTWSSPSGFFRTKARKTDVEDSFSTTPGLKCVDMVFL